MNIYLDEKMYRDLQRLSESTGRCIKGKSGANLLLALIRPSESGHQGRSNDIAAHLSCCKTMRGARKRGVGR